VRARNPGPILQVVTKQIDLALLPREALSLEADAFVLVDVLRATTTIAAMFAAGAARVTAVSELTAALALAQRQGALLFGEVGGLPPAGFDYGNSPLQARAAPLAGLGAVLFTTNGTRALCALAGRGAVAAGSLANATAVAAWAAGYERVAFVCAGEASGERFALEDFAAAAVLLRGLLQASAGAEVGDAGRLALETGRYDDWLRAGLPQQTKASARLIAGAGHAQALSRLGLAADVQFATRLDTAVCVPVAVEWGDGWVALEDARGASQPRA
jgi:2-phosphosulfolactate phosphatase